MSLLRLAFWLALIVMLLPTDVQQQARFANFANQAMGRMGTFCDRNGRTCDVGSEAWATFVRKAEFGMRLIGDLLGVGGRQQAADYPARPPAAERRPVRGYPRGTLAPPDYYPPPPYQRPYRQPVPYQQPPPYEPPPYYQPPWRGPQRPYYGG